MNEQPFTAPPTGKVWSNGEPVDQTEAHLRCRECGWEGGAGAAYALHARITGHILCQVIQPLDLPPMRNGQSVTFTTTEFITND